MKRLSILGAAALLALAGCGGSSNSTSTASTASSGGASTGASSSGGGGGGQQLSLQADPSQLKFNTNKLTAKAGKVTITMTNPSAIFQHNIALKGKGIKTKKGKVVGKGGTSKVTFKNLKRGTYTFFCSVPGHEAAGMKGKLVVK
jgi:plastocyanin